MINFNENQLHNSKLIQSEVLAFEQQTFYEILKGHYQFQSYAIAILSDIEHYDRLEDYQKALDQWENSLYALRSPLENYTSKVVNDELSKQLEIQKQYIYNHITQAKHLYNLVLDKATGELLAGHPTTLFEDANKFEKYQSLQAMKNFKNQF